MKYAEYTFKDRNPIKRLLQRRRLSDALACLGDGFSANTVIDFGGGDGEFSKHLAARFPEARVICYEPCSWLRAEAEEKLREVQNVSVVPSVDQLPAGSFDLLCCNEVFEHFPSAETDNAIGQIRKLLAGDGTAVIGVPVEIFLPALLKGIFRMTRRYGAYDARFSTVLRASLGIPARDRPVGDMGPDLVFHIPHMGFDHRVLRKRFERDFVVVRTRSSPIDGFGQFLNNEIYFVLRKTDGPA